MIYMARCSIPLHLFETESFSDTVKKNETIVDSPDRYFDTVMNQTSFGNDFEVQVVGSECDLEDLEDE